MVILTVAYVDRINVSLMITDGDFLKTFGLANDRVRQGELATVFLIGYGVSAWFLTPFFEAKLNVRQAFFVSVAAWVVFTGISAVTSALVLFLAWRALLGVAEGPLFSLKTMYVNQNFERGQVGKPNAISSIGVNLGLALGFPVVAFLVANFGWRDSFWALAVLNLVIGLPLVFFFIRIRPPAPAQPKAPRAEVTVLLRETLRTPHIWAILLVEICTLSYLWGASTWLPAYLKSTRHFELREMSVFSSLPFAAGILANIVGGWVIDKLPVSRTPLVFTLGGLATAASVTLAIVAVDPYVSASGLVLAGTCWAFQTPAIPTLVQYVSKREAVGSVYGLINGIGNLVAAAMPMLMGAAMTTRAAENVGQGFWLLVGSQVVVAFCGLLLYWRLAAASSR
jgi:predicted MFS family arabinose efflux permease